MQGFRIVLAIALATTIGCGDGADKDDPSKVDSNNTNNANNANNVNNLNNANNTNNANNLDGCVAVLTDTLQFGPVVVGQTATLLLDVQNCSESIPLDINAGAMGAFSTTGESGVSPGDIARIGVVFEPLTVGDFSAYLALETSAGSVNVATVASGFIDPATCPTARIALLDIDGPGNPIEETSALAETTVALTGELSEAVSGEVANYEWTLVSRPMGSTSSVSVGTAQSSVYLDRAGTFVVELNVEDDSGNPNCEPARVTILSLGQSEGYRFELTWDTPADADQTDNMGADMDLHYMHPDGTWNRVPWDCFWNNPNPDWSSAGLNSPRHTIDDSDGAGPEEIQHDALITPTVFSIGVYYYSSRNLGPSTATLRVYEGGSLVFEENKTLAVQRQFWAPIQISMQDGSVDSSGASILPMFPQ